MHRGSPWCRAVTRGAVGSPGMAVGDHSMRTEAPTVQGNSVQSGEPQSAVWLRAQ